MSARELERHEYCGHHVTWCTNHDGEFTMHTEDEPYCSHLLSGVRLVPEPDVVKTTAWVSPTSAFTHGRFTPADYAARGARYDGVEITIEHWTGPGIDVPEQKLRMSSDAARSLAAALIRAADIEQGLTR
ncbi:hypothetical protein [Mycolicibacterium gilvum]|uniref:hypothetical protein n=1 Tax=Mycolicibacterium gilvum TaxID=1804 RepID=UPI00404574EC